MAKRLKICLNNMKECFKIVKLFWSSLFAEYTIYIDNV